MRDVRMGSLALRVDDDQPTFWDRVETGAWEPGTLAVLDDLVGPDTTFLDLGSWVGALALYAAGQGARVVAVEADPAALRQLRANLAANPELATRITVLPRAASASPGVVRLGARRKPGDSMSSVLLADAPGSWTADAITPDELLGLVAESRELVVKIDIEGGEYDLLPALARLFEHAAAVMVAFHPEILAASGVREVQAREQHALRSLAEWSCARIDKQDAAPDGPGGPMRGEWLFQP